MSTIVRIVSSDLNLLNDPSILQKVLDALSVPGGAFVITPPIQSITVLEDSQEEEVENEVTVDSEETEFSSLVALGAEDLPMKEASRILNKNAWMIKGITLIPGFGDDPETEWTGFMSLLGSQVKDSGEFYVEADDYREILKHFALVTEIMDFGE